MHITVLLGPVQDSVFWDLLSPISYSRLLFQSFTAVSSPSRCSLWGVSHLKNPAAFTLVTVQDRTERDACILPDIFEGESHWI